MLILILSFSAGALVTLPVAATPETMTTVLGTGKPDRGANAGSALEVNIGDPFGVEIGPDGALYATEVRNHRVWRVDRKTGRARVVAGTGEKGYSGDGGPATAAKLNEPYEIRFEPDGTFYIVEMKNHIVRRVDGRKGTIDTVAGTGKRGYGGDDGLATKAMFSRPHSIALDGRGGLYIADIGNHRIRRVDLESGIVTTIAGTGEKELPAAGTKARGRPMLGPRALYVEKETLWIALREGHSVWKMPLATGVLEHVAGTGAKGYSGDNGPALRATMNGPKGIAIGPRGSVYVVDTENQAIRRIDTKTGTIETIAGRGPNHRGGGGDGGPARSAELARPHGVCVDRAGNVFIGDTLNHRVRRVSPAPPARRDPSRAENSAR